jgi:hypothetical protein
VEFKLRGAEDNVVGAGVRDVKGDAFFMVRVTF